MTEAERIRELEAESERLRKESKLLKYVSRDPTWMGPDEAEFWERVEAKFP